MQYLNNALYMFASAFVFYLVGAMGAYVSHRLIPIAHESVKHVIIFFLAMFFTIIGVIGFTISLVGAMVTLAQILIHT